MTNWGPCAVTSQTRAMYVKMEKDNKPRFASIEKTTRIAAPRGVDILDNSQFVRFRFNLYVKNPCAAFPPPKIDPQVENEKNGCVVKVHWYLTTSSRVNLSHSQCRLPPSGPCLPSSPALLEEKRISVACARRWAVNVRSRSLRTTKLRAEKVCACARTLTRVLAGKTGLWVRNERSVPLCNTISAALIASSDPSARRPTPSEVAGSKKRKQRARSTKRVSGL